MKVKNTMTNRSYYSREDRVAEFNKAAGLLPISINDSFDVSENTALNQLALLQEEVAEFEDAFAHYFDCLYGYKDERTDETYQDLLDARKDLVKEWADCQVTLSNMAYVLSINGNKAFERVHDSNMSKVIGTTIIRDPETKKILKPSTYFAPDMSDL